jgi:hypothetical protein
LNPNKPTLKTDNPADFWEFTPLPLLRQRNEAHIYALKLCQFVSVNLHGGGGCSDQYQAPQYNGFALTEFSTKASPTAFTPVSVRRRVAGVIEKEIWELKQADDLDRIDDPTVRRWKSLAEEGDAYFQYLTGGAYCEGYGWLEKDIQKGIRWLRKAAKQGHLGAQRCLSCVYAWDERGDLRDVVSGYVWFSIAMANFNTDDKSNEELEQQATVKALKDRLNKAMTPAQIKKAEEIVKELTQNNPKLIQKKQGSHP